MSTTTNALNNSATVFTVDNLNLDGNTLSSTSGDITLVPTSNRVGIDKSASGATLSCRVFNSSATGSSDAIFNAVSANGGGNAYSQWTDQNQSFQHGIVQGTASLREYVSGFSSGSLLRQMTSAGEQTLPLQSAFLAYLSANTAGVTGAGASYTIIFDTEVFDQNADYNNATGNYTAPVTSRVSFDALARLNSLTAAMTIGLITITTSNRTYRYELNASTFNASTNLSFIIGTIADMDAADTATVTVQVLNGAGNTAIVTGAATLVTYFAGSIIC